MKDIILCSSNPILIKSLYGVLRDEGYFVETIEHPSFAVQMVMRRPYDVILIDSEPFGLSAEDAAEILRAIAPAMPVLFIGAGGDRERQRAVAAPLDLEELKRTILGIAA